MPGRYHKHARKGGVPMHEWIVERPFDSADYLDGPPPSYVGSPAPDPNPMAPQASTTEGGAVSAVTEAVQEGLRDAAASRERWRRWEMAHGLENHAAPYQVKAGTGGMFHVHNAETGGGKSLPMAAKDAHARATELNKDHVASLNAVAPEGIHLGTTRTADGQHMVTVGKTGAAAKRSTLKWNPRKKQLEGNYRGVKMEKGPAYQFTIGKNVHTARWDGTVDANGEPVFKHVDTGKQLSAAAADSFDRLDKIAPGHKMGDKVSFDIGRRTVSGEVSGFHANGTKVAVQTPEGEYVLPHSEVRRRKTQEAEMTTVEQAVREVLEAKAATRTVVCPSCGAKNTVDMEDVADGGKDEKAEGDKPLVCSKCGKSLAGALGKAAKGKGTSISEAADSMAKASSPEPFSSSKTSNWVARAGGLPAYIQHIAHDLMEKRGKSESNAIQMAIGIVKNWASGKGNVDANTRAAAAKAVAEWEALKAKSKAKGVAESVQVSMWEDAELAGTEREVIAEAEALCADTDRLLAIQEAADSKSSSDGDGPSNEGGIKVKCMACGKRGIPTKDSNCPNCGKSVASALAFAKRMKAKSKVAEAEEEPGPIERAIMEGLGNG